MKKQLVIADTGALISLALLEKVHFVDELFGVWIIPEAVLNELEDLEPIPFHARYLEEFRQRKVAIKATNHLRHFMDYGESEAVILYQELEADFLLIDDRKARSAAETMGVECIGSIGILVEAKHRSLVSDLRPIFVKLLKNNRFFSKKFLNGILGGFSEKLIK